VLRKIRLEEGHLRDDEEDSHRACNKMGDAIEEKEARGFNCHDQHYPTSHCNQEKDNDVESPENIKNYVAGTADLGVCIEIEHPKSECSDLLISEYGRMYL